MNSAFQDALAREKALKDKTYKVVVKVWIDAGGKVARIALVDKTGDAKVDELLKDVLQNLRALRERSARRHAATVENTRDLARLMV